MMARLINRSRVMPSMNVEHIANLKRLFTQKSIIALKKKRDVGRGMGKIAKLLDVIIMPFQMLQKTWNTSATAKYVR